MEMFKGYKLQQIYFDSGSIKFILVHNKYFNWTYRQ